MEDTKTFLRILPLLQVICLDTIIAGDGYSAPEQFQRTSCPSLPVLILIVSNPLHLSTLVAVVGIPLYSTGNWEIVSKTEECSNAHKNVDRSVPLTTASDLVHHTGC